MAYKFWKTFILMVFLEVAISKPLKDANEGKEATSSHYRQLAETFLLSTETVVMDLYDSLPELKTEFDAYLNSLSDYKQNTQNDTAVNKELLTHWFKLLNMIKAIHRPEITKIQTTVIKSLPLKEPPKDQLTPFEAELKLQLNDLRSKSDLANANKALALLNKMAEWDETHDKESFANETNALKFQFLGYADKPRLVAEYRRLKDFYMESFESSPSSEKLLLFYELGGYLYAIKYSMQTVDKKTIETAAAFRTANSNPTAKEDNYLKSTFKKLSADSEDQRYNEAKVKYLEEQLQHLKYKQQLSVSQKSLLLIIAMAQWEKRAMHHDSFYAKVNNFRGFFVEQDNVPFVLVEYIQLRKLHTYLLKNMQSYDTVLTISELGHYLKHFKADSSVIPKGTRYMLPVPNKYTYSFWRQCIYKQCSDETFWQLILLDSKMFLI